MITWQFSLEKQIDIYSDTERKIKNGFYQDLNLYILPRIPNKFRNRVVYFPNFYLPKKIYSKHKRRLSNLEIEWKNDEEVFFKKLEKYFPKLNNIEIIITPSLYGTVGSYDTKYDKLLYIYPRYDRKLIDTQKLLINALTHFFFFDRYSDLDSADETWFRKQEMSKKIQEEIFPNTKYKSMTDIINRQFLGNLAIESDEYLKKLGHKIEKEIIKPTSLTKNESKVFDLLYENKNKLVSFEKVSEVIWGDQVLEKYSEYAITKLIERLKRKLPKHTIHSNRNNSFTLVS